MNYDAECKHFTRLETSLRFLTGHTGPRLQLRITLMGVSNASGGSACQGSVTRQRLHIVQAKIDSVSTKTPRELAGQISYTCFIIGNGRADCTHNFYIGTGLRLMHANF